jgi:hypothetical protein
MRDDERAAEDGDTPGVTPADEVADEELVAPFGETGEEDDLDEVETEAVADAEPAAESVSAPLRPAFVPPVFNNFMDALYPAKAPSAKNARIIRRFDLEAAKYDPRPNNPAPAPTPMIAPAAPEKKEPALTREELRALRNRSLRAAAGLG